MSGREHNVFVNQGASANTRSSRGSHKPRKLALGNYRSTHNGWKKWDTPIVIILLILWFRQLLLSSSSSDAATAAILFLLLITCLDYPWY